MKKWSRASAVIQWTNLQVEVAKEDEKNGKDQIDYK